MGWFYPRAFAVLISIAAAGSAAAQGALTEREFLEVLEQDHPALVAAGGRLATAEGDRGRAGRLANPRASAEWELPEDATQQSTFTLAWTPPLDGRRGLRVRASEAGLEAARADIEAQALDLRITLRRLFAEWAIAAEVSRAAAAHLDRVKRLGAQMSARAESGEESGLAARRLELAAVEIEAIAARAEAAEAVARQTAAAWHPGVENDSPVRPDLPEAPAELDSAASPVLRVQEHEVAQLEAEARLAGRVIDFPELEAGWQTQEDPASKTFAGPVFGASWQLPLFDRQQGDRAATARRLEAARARLELTRRLSRAQIEGARAAYARLRESALGSLRAVDGADAVVEGAAAAYQLGESRLTDLLETLRAVLASRVAALELYVAALEAHRNLEAAAGQPLSELDGGR